MKNGYKLEDKCLRNELLILINYLMSDEKALYFFYEKQNLPDIENKATFLEILLYLVLFYINCYKNNKLMLDFFSELKGSTKCLFVQYSYLL